MMGHVCSKFMGLFVLVAGIAFLMLAMGSMAAVTVYWIAGAMFALFGLGKLVHVSGMCPMCNAEMKGGSKRK
jgi:hypothetical protein